MEYQIENITQIYVFVSGSEITIYEMIIAPNNTIVFEIAKANQLIESDNFNYGSFKSGAGLNFVLLFRDHFSEFQFFLFCPFNQHESQFNIGVCTDNRRNEYSLALPQPNPYINKQFNCR